MGEVPGREMPARVVVDHLVWSAVVALFGAGAVAWCASQLWAPLAAFVFWPLWVVLTVWLLFRAEIAPRRCWDCLAKARRGALRCRHCGSSLT
jgi:hypothetical protein